MIFWLLFDQAKSSINYNKRKQNENENEYLEIQNEKHNENVSEHPGIKNEKQNENPSFGSRPRLASTPAFPFHVPRKQDRNVGQGDDCCELHEYVANTVSICIELFTFSHACKTGGRVKQVTHYFIINFNL